MTFINACSLNTRVSQGAHVLEFVYLCTHLHIIACGDFPNEHYPTFSHDCSLIARESPLPLFCPLRLFSLLRIWTYSISPPRPIYLIQSLSCNWNFYWDEGDNSCKCANWCLAPGRDVKPSKGIKKSRVWNAAHSHVMYHAAPLGHSRLADCGIRLSLLAAECNLGHAPLLISTSVHKTPFVPLLWLQKSSLLLKGKGMCNTSAMQFQSFGHMLRHICDYNQTACEDFFEWQAAAWVICHVILTIKEALC